VAPLTLSLPHLPRHPTDAYTIDTPFLLHSDAENLHIHEMVRQFAAKSWQDQAQQLPIGDTANITSTYCATGGKATKPTPGHLSPYLDNTSAWEWHLPTSISHRSATPPSLFTIPHLRKSILPVPEYRHLSSALTGTIDSDAAAALPAELQTALCGRAPLNNGRCQLNTPRGAPTGSPGWVSVSCLNIERFLGRR
jgi:hypothetical protein